jgi:hypothetical protein
MKARCKLCGDMFKVDPETLELVEEGYLSHDTPGLNVCDECAELDQYNVSFEYEMFSDADPGL